MCGCSDEQETVKLWLWMSPAHTLTLRRSCCSACRPQWSHQFYLCCPVGGERTKRPKSWCANFILRHCFFFPWKDSCNIWELWLQGWFLIWETERLGRRQRRGRDTERCGQAVWATIKKLPVVFFSHWVLRTSWRIPKTFQPQIPNVTPPDANKKAAPLHWAQIKACLALTDNNLFFPVTCSWERIACSWNVLGSQQTTEVVWF